jgi:hypothetical protein
MILPRGKQRLRSAARLDIGRGLDLPLSHLEEEDPEGPVGVTTGTTAVFSQVSRAASAARDTRDHTRLESCTCTAGRRAALGNPPKMPQPQNGEK